MRKILYKTIAMTLSAAMCISGFSVKALANETEPEKTEMTEDLSDDADYEAKVDIPEQDAVEPVVAGLDETNRDDKDIENAVIERAERDAASCGSEASDVDEKADDQDLDAIEESDESDNDENDRAFGEDGKDIAERKASNDNADKEQAEDNSLEHEKVGFIDEEKGEIVLTATELSAEAGSQTITASGDMPDGAELSVQEITYMEMAENAVNEAFSESLKFTAVHAFDIRILVGDEEWQPVDDETSVKITISELGISDAGDFEKIRVYRIEDDDAGVTDMNAEVDGDSVTFETEHFTVYTVGSTDYETDDADMKWDLSAEEDGSIMAYWYEDDSQLIITGSGEMMEYSYDMDNALKERQFNVKWVNADGITSISDFLFYDCRKMTMDYLPSGITRIGNTAFGFCESLTLTALPEGLTSIGNGAFEKCDSMIISEFPKGIVNIGDCAFAYCEGLEADVVLSGLESIGYSAFSDSGIKSLDLSGCSELTKLGFSTCLYCDKLEKVVLPESITTIGEMSFSGCTALKSVNFSGGDAIESIGYNTFSGCKSLTSVELPRGLKIIEYGAFCDSGLTEIDFSGCKNLVEIEQYAFRSCPLTDITFSNSIEIIGDEVFRWTKLNELDLSACTSLANIGNFAFADCLNLTKLTIPDTLKSLDKFGIFYGCNNLTMINGGNNLENVDISTFIITFNSANYEYDMESELNEGRADFTYRYYNLRRIQVGEESQYIVTNVDSLAEALNDYDWEYACRRTPKIIIVDGVEYDVTYADSYDLSIAQNKQILAYYFIQDGVPYLLVSGKGAMKDYYYNSEYGHETSPLRDIREYTLIWDDQGITTIGDCVFKNYWYMYSDDHAEFGTNITALPAGLKRIGMQAFMNTGISAELPETITEIGMTAFQGCSNMTTDHLPSDLKILGPYVFSFCDGITRMTIHEGIRSQMYGAGYLSDGILMGCENLETVNLPGDIKAIGTRAFISCPNLKKCELPESVTEIKSEAFIGCKSLDMERFPEGLKSIGEMAFASCSSLTKVNFSDGMDVGSKAFYGCEKLTSITASGGANLGYAVFGLTANRIAQETGNAYSLPLKTVLNGDADWFDTYDFKADHRLIGGYTVTLPMSVDLRYDNKGSLGDIDFEVLNETNGWNVKVDGDVTKNLTNKDGRELAVSLEHSNSLKAYEVGDTTGKVLIKTLKTPDMDGVYAGTITFTTGLVLE